MWKLPHLLAGISDNQVAADDVRVRLCNGLFVDLELISGVLFLGERELNDLEKQVCC